jgi:hypothetical protein
LTTLLLRRANLSRSGRTDGFGRRVKPPLTRRSAHGHG